LSQLRSRKHSQCSEGCQTSESSEHSSDDGSSLGTTSLLRDTELLDIALRVDGLTRTVQPWIMFIEGLIEGEASSGQIVSALGTLHTNAIYTVVHVAAITGL